MNKFIRMLNDHSRGNDSIDAHECFVTVEAIRYLKEDYLTKNLPNFDSVTLVFLALNDDKNLRKKICRRPDFSSLLPILEILEKKKITHKDVTKLFEIAESAGEMVTWILNCFRNYRLDDPDTCGALAGYSGFGKLRSANLALLAAVNSKVWKQFDRCIRAKDAKSIVREFSHLEIDAYAAPALFRAVLFGLWRGGRNEMIPIWLKTSSKIVSYHVNGSPAGHIEETRRIVEKIVSG